MGGGREGRAEGRWSEGWVGGREGRAEGRWSEGWGGGGGLELISSSCDRAGGTAWHAPCMSGIYLCRDASH